MLFCVGRVAPCTSCVIDAGSCVESCLSDDVCVMLTLFKLVVVFYVCCVCVSSVSVFGCVLLLCM